jgi:hypothetical protein
MRRGGGHPLAVDKEAGKVWSGEKFRGGLRRGGGAECFPEMTRYGRDK